MDEEFDLRPYIELLIRRWYWIIGAAVIAAILTYGLTFLGAPSYEATSLIAIADPSQLVQFDNRFEPALREEPLKAYPELALSDELLESLLDESEPPLNGFRTVSQLRRVLKTEAGSDPSLIRLSAHLNQPEESARLANAWSERFVEWANEIYGNTGSTQVEFYENQLALAEKELNDAENALVEFQAINQMQVISNTLGALNQVQTDYLIEQQDLKRLIVDVQGLHEQLAAGSNNEAITLADQLTALVLQMRTFNADASTPIEIRIEESGNFSDISRAEQVEALEQLVDTLDSRLAIVSENLEGVEPEILLLQGQLQGNARDFDRLSLDRDLAKETYLSLARKVEEERIQAEDTNDGVRLASRAAVPDQPAGAGRIINVAVAAVFALLLASVIVLVVAWWRQDFGGSQDEG